MAGASRQAWSVLVGAAVALAGSGRPVQAQEHPPSGLGPTMSAVYRVAEGLSIAGHGEFLFQVFEDELESEATSPLADRWDAVRAVLYIGYALGEGLRVNTGVAVRPAEGAVLDLAYLEYRPHRAVALRAGLLPVPMGLLNEAPEAPTFLGTTRPAVERRLIPTSWRENGVGVAGTVGPVRLRGYVMNGLRGLGFTATGLRAGRQHGANALAEDLVGVARADYTGLRGLVAGGSLYHGGSGQGATAGTHEVEATTTITEAHVQYQGYGLELRTLVARAAIEEADLLNAAGAVGAAQELGGGYAQVGYDILRPFGSQHQLLPYARYEWLDTQREVEEGMTPTGANDAKALLVGLAWRPVPEVAVKADYQVHTNEAATGRNRIAISLGYMF